MIKYWLIIVPLYIVYEIKTFFFGGSHAGIKVKWFGSRLLDWISEDQECWRCKQNIGWWAKKDGKKP